MAGVTKTPLPTQTKFAMNEDVKRNEFDEICVNTIFALNGLMQTREVCKAGKAVTKINRFKQWVMELQDSVNWADRKRHATEQPTIHFEPSDCPEIAY